MAADWEFRYNRIERFDLEENSKVIIQLDKHLLFHLIENVKPTVSIIENIKNLKSLNKISETISTQTIPVTYRGVIHEISNITIKGKNFIFTSTHKSSKFIEYAKKTRIKSIAHLGIAKNITTKNYKRFSKMKSFAVKGTFIQVLLIEAIDSIKYINEPIEATSMIAEKSLAISNGLASAIGGSLTYSILSMAVKGGAIAMFGAGAIPIVGAILVSTVLGLTIEILIDKLKLEKVIKSHLDQQIDSIRKTNNKINTIFNQIEKQIKYLYYPR